MKISRIGKCHHCGTDFETTSISRKFCSVRCKGLDFHKRFPEKRALTVKKFLSRKPENYKKSVVLKHKFGISIEEFEAKLLEQDYKCAICGEPETARYRRGVIDKPKYLAVDHNHKTGKNRGLLCTRCNQALGHVLENEEIALKLVDYIRKHKD